MHNFVACPSCHHAFHLPRDAAPGDIVKCFGCGSRFRLVPNNEVPASRRSHWMHSLPTAAPDKGGLERVNARGSDRYCAAGDDCGCGLPKVCVKHNCNCSRAHACNGKDHCACGRALKVCTKSGCRCGRPVAHIIATVPYPRTAESRPRVPNVEWSSWQMPLCLGRPASVAGYRTALAAKGMHVGPSTCIASQMLENVIVSSAEIRVTLTRISVAELGFRKQETKLSDIYGRARDRGLEICPAEVGPKLRLEYLSQPAGEYLRIAMEPINTVYGLQIFAVDHPKPYEGQPYGLWLHPHGGNPDAISYPDHEFIFIKTSLGDVPTVSSERLGAPHGSSNSIWGAIGRLLNRIS